MNIRSGLAVVAASVALTGPSLLALAEEVDDQGADQRIGPEVSKVCFGSNINGWKSVKGEDNVVLLEKGVNHWYRVEVSGACRERVFRFAHVIGIDSRPAGGCVRRGDVILVEDGGNFVQRCYIRRIYEWDDDAPAPGEEETAEEENSDA